MIIYDAHQSGHQTATARQERTAVTRVSKGRTVFGMTEAQAIVNPDGFSSSTGESRIFWDQKSWKKTANGTLLVPTTEWTRGTDTRSGVEFPWVLLTSKGTYPITLLRIIAHLPAHLTDPKQAAANLAAIRGAPLMIKTLITTYDPDEVTLSLDANRDVRLARNQELFHKGYHQLGLHLIAPPAGTFGQRKIDPFLSTTHLHNKGMYPQFPGLDHTGWWLTYADDA